MTDFGFTADAAVVSRALGQVTRIMERNTTIPILSAALIDVGPDGVFLTGTDLDMETRVRIDATAHGEGRAVFPPRALHRMVRAAKGSIVTANFSDEKCTWQAGGFELALRSLLPAEDFPDLQLRGNAIAHATVSEAELHEALSLVAPAMSKEETRYYLNGVYLHASRHREGKSAALVATDGHRMCVLEAGWQWPEEGGVILPRKAVREIMSTLTAGGNRPVTMRGGELWFEVEDEDTRFRTRTIDGTYPDYTRVIPKQEGIPKIVASITRHAARSLCAMGAVSAEGRSIQIEFRPGDGKAIHRVIGGDMTISAPISGAGKPFALSAHLLTSLIGNSECVTLRSDGPGDPFVVDTENPNLTRVLMPMRI